MVSARSDDSTGKRESPPAPTQTRSGDGRPLPAEALPVDGPPEPEDVSGLAALPGVLLVDPVFDGRRSPTLVATRPATAALPAGAEAPGRASAADLASSTDAPGAPEKGWVGVREWAAGFLLAQRSGHTRRAYVGDLQHFLGWCVQVGLAPGRVARADLDRYARVLELTPSERTGRPLAAASRARRLAVVAGLYRYAAQELGWASSPAAHLTRPRTGSETPPGPSRVEVAALLAAAQADSPRAAALVSLLVHTGLRIDEALSRDVADWRRDAGHEVLELQRKGGRDGVTVLPASVVRALRSMLAARAGDHPASVDSDSDGDPDAVEPEAGESGAQPLFATATGGRVDQPTAWRLIRRLAVTAGIDPAERVSPHALRHAFITFALDAGASLRDVQDAAGHADPATTRAYDEARGRLDRHPAYAVGAHLAATDVAPATSPAG